MQKKNINFEDLPQDAASLKKIIDSALEAFEKNKFGQYRLSIPSGVVTKIDTIRDSDFYYLADSLYKSNISYLVQQVNFQIWIYKLFGPKYSLENSLFYVLKLLLAIMTETLIVAILYNPLIKEEADRSLGDVAACYQDIQQAIGNMSFYELIHLGAEAAALNEEHVNYMHEIRKLRNEVHLQGKRERIYNNMDFKKFSAEYDLINKTLTALKKSYARKPLSHTPADLRKLLFAYKGDDKNFFEGRVTHIQRKDGFGHLSPYVERKAVRGILYFNKESIGEELFKKLKRNQKVLFRFFLGPNGLAAQEIKEL